MRFIENLDLREWVKDNLRRAVFQKVHELAVQTGCEVLVKLQDSSHSSQYYATQALHLQYEDKGLCKQPWDVKVSGLTGLPEAILVERGCQIDGKGYIEEADSGVNEESDAAEPCSMQVQEPRQARPFYSRSEIISAKSFSPMGCEERTNNSCSSDYKAEEHFTSHATSCSVIQTEDDSKGYVPQEGNELIPGGSGTGESYVSDETQPNEYLGFAHNDDSVPTSNDLLFQTAATYSIGFPINKFQAQTKSMNSRTIFPGQVLANSPAPALMHNANKAEDAEKPVLKPYQCGICRKTFGSIQILSRHGQINHGLDKRMSFSCNVCGQSYKIAKHLQRHMRMHHSVMPYICPICNKGFFNGTSLTKHVKIHEQLNESNQFLAVQGSGTNRQDVVPSEMSTPEGQLSKDTADKAAREALELGAYPANIPSLPGPSRIIPIFPQNLQIDSEDQYDSQHPISEEQNMDREHPHQMSWQDASLGSDNSNCNTSTPITYIRNIGLFSTGHLCHLCGKSYKYSSTFKEHLLTHSSVPRFTCKICSEPFTRQRQFRDHMIHHTGTYPYHCLVCGKGFIRPSIMKKHQCVEQFQ